MARSAASPSSTLADAADINDWPSRRACSAEDTLRRVRPWFETFGITRLARVTLLDLVGIPVWTAVRPNSRTLSVSQGKGLDDDAARASAAMEALELAVAEHPLAPVVFASADELAMAGRAFETLPSLVRRNASFDPGATHPWLQGFDVATHGPVLVPL